MSRYRELESGGPRIVSRSVYGGGAVNRPVVLIIGGLDPSGGAGLAADIQTATALGAHPAPVASLITVQDTRRVYASEALRPELVAAQAGTILQDMPVAAVKLGALGAAAVGRAVAEVLADTALPVVTDPVLAASGGGELIEPGLGEVYAQALFPHCTVATPNRGEFEALGGEPALAAWFARGLGACLVTGGDADSSRVRHILYTPSGEREIDAGRSLEGAFHGSGCTLASAIAARLARGDALEHAIGAAERFVRRALTHSFSPGQGQSVPGRW